MPDLSIVIISWNTSELLQDCLASLDMSAQVIVVDNGSTDDSAEMVAQHFPQVHLIQNDRNVGFASANNQGIAISQGRYILLLNSDTLVKPDALTQLVAFMNEHAAAGAVSPRLTLPGGEPQAFAFGGDPSIGYLIKRGLYRMLLRRPIHNWRTDQIQAVNWVSGACLLVRRTVIDQVGGLDENIFMYFEDVDWCKRIRQAGWQVMFNPQIEIVHLGGQSLAQNSAARQAYDRSLRYFYGKHYGPLARLLLGLFLTFYRDRAIAI